MRTLKYDEENFIPANGIIKAASMHAAANIEQLIKQSEKTLIENESQVAKRLVDAETRGFEEGYQDGLREFSEAVERYNFALDGLLNDVEPILMAALQHLIGSVENKVIFTAMVKKALGAVRDEKKIIIRVHPEQENILRQHLFLESSYENNKIESNENRQDVPFGGNVVIEADHTIAPMSCDIFTPREVFSVSISIILEQFIMAFKQPGIFEVADHPPKRQNDLFIHQPNESVET